MNRNYPSSEISILAVNHTNAQAPSDVASATVINDLPMLNDVDANGDELADVWEAWGAEWRDVHVVDEAGETTDVYNLTTNDIFRNQDNYNTLRGMIVDAATSGNVALTQYQNAVEPLDVTNDGNVVPNDVLRIFNKFNTDGPTELTGDVGSSYYDVNGDGFLTALDAIRVIRHLNAVSTFGSGEPPVESSSDSAQAESVEQAAAEAGSVDAFFAIAVADEATDDDDSANDES